MKSFGWSTSLDDYEQIRWPSKYSAPEKRIGGSGCKETQILTAKSDFFRAQNANGWMQDSMKKAREVKYTGIALSPTRDIVPY